MRQRQQGFALVAAIALVVVLAALAGFVASLTGAQSADGQLSRSAQRVERAAQSGLEWGAYQVMRQAVPVCNPAATLLPLAAYPNVSVQVTCQSAPTSEPRASGPGNVVVYRIMATATTGGIPASPDYAEHQRTAVFSR